MKIITESDLVEAMKKIVDDFKIGKRIPMSKSSETYYKNLIKKSRIPDELWHKKFTI